MKIHCCTTCWVVVVLLGVLSDAQIWENISKIKKPLWPTPRPIWPPTQRPVWPPTQRPVWPPTQRPVWPPTQRPVWPKPLYPTKKPVWPPTQRPVWPPTQKPVWPPTQRPVWPKPSYPTKKPIWPPTQRPVWPPTQRPVWPPTQRPAWPNTWPATTPPVSATLTSVIGIQTPPNCDVEPSVKITCGSGITSAAGCTAINCCFDGQRCFYGKFVTVQATKDGQIVVVVSKQATLPTLDLTSVRLRNDADPQCRPVAFNSAFIVFQFPVTACGTSVREGTDFIVYENSMESSYDVSFGPLGYITRDSYFNLAFLIRYIGTSIQTLTVEILDKNNPLNVYGYGPLDLELRLGNGQCTVKGCSDENMYYSSYYSTADYPITKVLRDPVYVEVRVKDNTDSSLVLILDHCWATNSPMPHSIPQWDLLVGGCPNPNDNKYLTTLVQVGSSPNVQFPSHYKRFIVKMFTFINQSTRLPMTNQVYFHCSATVCHSAVANCAHSCQRKRRDVSEDPRTDDPRASTVVVVSSGKVILTESSVE